MRYYDFFSFFYDSSLESLYRLHREAAAEALRLDPGMTVLDLPCGTGQSFDCIAPQLTPGGLLLGIDLSKGMLKKARKRVARLGFDHVCILEGDALSQSLADSLADAAERPVTIDRLHIFLGMTVFDDWRETFDHLWALLKPRGRCVMVDCFMETLGVHGRIVNARRRAVDTGYVEPPASTVTRRGRRPPAATP
jgi:ubiquinone/menaquinone biosynthesis C-methylase UbiE